MSQACARFLCCERPAWQTTATPVGICVSRTADSVLLTCWPPAPPERIVSVRTSDSVDVDLDAVVDHRKDRDADENEVCRRALESNGEIRTSRCTPASVFSQP